MSPIDEELNWRDKELALAKMQFAAAPKDSELRKYLAKVLVLISYAHYEGFVKYCWDRYINHIKAKNLKIKQLETKIRQIALQEHFSEVKKSWNIQDFISHLENHQAILDSIANKIEPLETNSNLWPNLLKDNNEKISIILSTLDPNIAKVKKLVGLRNNLAHGEKIQLTNEDEILDLAEAAGEVMIDLALQIEEAIRIQKFLNPLEQQANPALNPAAPATTTA